MLCLQCRVDRRRNRLRHQRRTAAVPWWGRRFRLPTAACGRIASPPNRNWTPMKITRRSALGILASTAAVVTTEQQADAQPAPAGAINLNWLGSTAPALETGVSWGVPWARGTVRREQTFTLSAPDGKALPLQSWPLAYWPD